MYGHAYGNALHYGLSMFVEFGMYGNRFEHNLNDLCQKEKCINMHRVYEHIYFSIFKMIFFVSDAYDSGTYLEYMLCFCEYYHFLTTIEQHESKQSLQNRYF